MITTSATIVLNSVEFGRAGGACAHHVQIPVKAANRQHHNCRHCFSVTHRTAIWGGGGGGGEREGGGDGKVVLATQAGEREKTCMSDLHNTVISCTSA